MPHLQHIRLLIAAITLSIACSDIQAGVTLHYEGVAKDRTSAAQALSMARTEAQRHGWKVEDATVTNASITRVIDEVEKPYNGSLTGIVIYPHPMCEPLYLQFDSDLFLQDFVKTQFSGPDIHVSIVQLLRKIQPYFREFKVDDEGEYWATGDRTKLLKNLDSVNTMIAAIKRSQPRAQGPIKLSDGRIMDITTP
jgi:hypothetical protein